MDYDLHILHIKYSPGALLD